ncbi:heparinase II/III family protein [Microbulbifer sp. CAU 1566]|uniref:heparinase II/III domain-containing protein n=1 Tax=Microbulbifer sp. CAU 1566 TaxID=2933269 RepID=UPI0020037D07|nr:heparinase II/III family protein [Microbulbifer sp. CAU 1566]MCK7598146.1 heparinase II/III family protein [Microbulbifer sp. CAU 1566]
MFGNSIFKERKSLAAGVALAAGVSAAVFAVNPLAAFGANHPNLVISAADVDAMQGAVEQPGRFRTAFLRTQSAVDRALDAPIAVPVPADAGGGYTHEQHKKNYQLMYNAGVLYQVTEDAKYAERVRDMLLAYADMYSTLPLHPKRRPGAENPGKLFWQSLNEAVWLVYTIQAYDLIRPSLTDAEAQKIEQGALRPVAKFLSVDSPKTFNKVHNHGTWLTAGVGMAGYVLDEPEWVEQALLDLDKSGKGGFLRQLSTLFSPDGYYNEGPYYQRYALMPFVTFAKAIENNEPERGIFDYRDGIVMKAIDTTIQLSYNNLFFPINDAIKSKGIDTSELVLGVTIAYGESGNPQLLDIAAKQNQILLSGDGLKVAQALDAGKQQPYEFKSFAFRDGKDGDEGALVVLRQQIDGDQALLFKPAAQGMGHGHFDKLTWQFYDRGEEIVTDYGAARFLNVEAKNGGRYLEENETWAKQTVAHNTLVVDETSHFDNNLKVANQNHPSLLFFHADDQVKISAAEINSAYPGVSLKRTLALVNNPESGNSFAIDVFDVESTKKHQLDLPLHYNGQLVDTSFKLQGFTDSLKALGTNNGFQHLWLKARGKPESGLAQVTWLNDNGRFYTQSSLVDGETELLFTELGANDPNFNLRSEKGFITRRDGVKTHTFVSVLEPHGEYNPSREFTLEAESQVQALQHRQAGDLELIAIGMKDGATQLLAYNRSSNVPEDLENIFEYDGRQYQFSGRAKLFQITN